MKLGDCIRTLREAAGLQQRELAERVGISKSMLSLLEAGKREPSISLLRALGRSLNVPTSVLFAVALAEDDSGGSGAKKMRSLTKALFDAAVSSLRAEHGLNVNQQAGKAS